MNRVLNFICQLLACLIKRFRIQHFICSCDQFFTFDVPWPPAPWMQAFRPQTNVQTKQIPFYGFLCTFVNVYIHLLEYSDLLQPTFTILVATYIYYHFTFGFLTKIHFLKFGIYLDFWMYLSIYMYWWIIGNLYVFFMLKIWKYKKNLFLL